MTLAAHLAAARPWLAVNGRLVLARTWLVLRIVASVLTRPRAVFDICMLTSLLLVSTGARLQWGLPVGLMVAGTLLALFTLISLYVGRR